MYRNQYPISNESASEEAYQWFREMAGLGTSSSQPGGASSSNSDSFSASANAIATDLFGGAEGGYGVPYDYSGVDTSGLYSSTFNYEQPREEGGVLSGVLSFFQGSPEREPEPTGWSTQSTWGEPNPHQNTWGGAYPNNQWEARPWDAYPWGAYNQGSVDQGQQASSSSVNERSEPEPSSRNEGAQESSASVSDDDIAKMIDDWNRFQANFLNRSDSDTAVENAIQNLGILYLNSLAFRGTVATLSNALRSNGRKLYLESRSQEKACLYSHEKSFIVFNPAAYETPGRLLGALALHVARATYNNLIALQGLSKKEVKQMSLERTALYYEQAGPALEEMGLGSRGRWKKVGPKGGAVVREPLSVIDEQEEVADTSSVNPLYEEPSSPPAYQAQAQRVPKKSGWKKVSGGLMRSLKNLKI